MMEHLIGDVPAFRKQVWLSDMAASLLPVEGYVTAKELSESDDECEAVTELLEILVETGHAISMLEVVGEDKEWIYGRNNVKFL